MSRLRRIAIAKARGGLPQVKSRSAPSRRDRIILAAWILMVPLLIGLLAFTVLMVQWRRSIDDRLKTWRTVYHLTDETAAKFRQIELDFHGSGNPITTPISHTAEEEEQHHQEMASYLPPEDREAFLRDLRSGRWKH